ncbi:VOC family protein [Flavobacterium cerinum]|uniref:VOC family protein n=1 Tax=Flavobacterium cerinum TaxID=2502784 RepID=A0ABY5IRY5_9FLAO|nr:VOC family protein [Flavobacterium cerinum]UUC45035.1 VOC family protein [Flavobacterium cerinum]
MIQFAYTILYVQNVASAMTFYEKAFGFQRKFITPDEDYGELISGATTLSFAVHTLAKSNLKDGYIESNIAEKPFGIELGFTTENVEKTVEEALLAGGTLTEPVKTKPWGQKVAYVRDTEGFLVEICSPM